MLVQIHINIVDMWIVDITLADVANQFVDREDSRRQTLGYFSQNYS